MSWQDAAAAVAMFEDNHDREMCSAAFGDDEPESGAAADKVSAASPSSASATATSYLT